MRFLLSLVFAIPTYSALAQSPVAPPPMTKRVIAPSTNELQGTRIPLNDGGVGFTLFLPPGWTKAPSGHVTLSVHFHLVPWFSIQEHIRRGASEPLLVFALGEGSTTYRVPFEDTNRFARVLALAQAEFQKRSGMADLRISSVDVSSFSAGYGAVRELIQSPEYFGIIRRIVLFDSMYAALEATNSEKFSRVPRAAQIDVWLPFARAAMRGEKTFVLTHSQVPTTTYASSAECAGALLTRLELKAQPVLSNTIPAASDPDFPLLARLDHNGLHIWSYAGADAQAHMTHARHMADVWRALGAESLRSQGVK